MYWCTINLTELKFYFICFIIRLSCTLIRVDHLPTLFKHLILSIEHFSCSNESTSSGSGIARKEITDTTPEEPLDDTPEDSDATRHFTSKEPLLLTSHL